MSEWAGEKSVRRSDEQVSDVAGENERVDAADPEPYLHRLSCAPSSCDRSQTAFETNNCEATFSSCKQGGQRHLLNQSEVGLSAVFAGTELKKRLVQVD